MLKQLGIFLFISLIPIFSCLKPEPTESYPNELVLDSENNYFLYWMHDSTEITFEVHVKNSKWFLFGISRDGFSDVVVGWLQKDHTGHFSDRALFDDYRGRYLEVDDKQDWEPLNATIIDEYVLFKFSRKIKIPCNLENNRIFSDLNIETGKIELVFSSASPDLDIDYDTDSINNIDSLEFKRKEVSLLDPNYDYVCEELVNNKKEFTSKPSEYYTNNVDLVENEFRFYWNYSSTDIVGELHCRTNGWISFGLSPNGGMHQSDVIVGWISSNGAVHFTDRYIDDKRVLIDKNQDWILLNSYEMGEYTVFKFTRKIKLCDPDDRVIEEGTPYVIYAWGESDPAPGQDIGYHFSNRGSLRINLISSSSSHVDTIETDLETIKFSLSNVILPAESTSYFCKAFKVPDELEKRHIVKWELVLPEKNLKSLHHTLIYECNLQYAGNPKYVPGDCFDNQIKAKYCNVISFGWAVGGELVSIFPEDTGYPIGGDSDYRYFVNEIHYDNPEETIGYIEKIDLVYHMTKNLKKHELGILTLGALSTPVSISIPPGLDEFGISAYCYNSCLRKKLENFNYTVIMAAPHTHLAGTEVYTKIVRDGVDIGYLHRNKYYDFNFQQALLLNPYVNITKNDELITYCKYNTKDRKHFTIGGESTQKEMCFNFLTYYPRTKFAGCVSFPYLKEMSEFLNELNKTENLNIQSINDISEKNVFVAIDEVIKKLDQKPELSESLKLKFKEFYSNAKNSFVCQEEYIEGPLDSIKPANTYEEADVCYNN